jgi:hypothetical protein
MGGNPKELVPGGHSEGKEGDGKDGGGGGGKQIESDNDEPENNEEADEEPPPVETKPSKQPKPKGKAGAKTGSG